MKKPDNMLTVKQVSDRLGVSLSMAYGLIKRGELGCHKIGRCIRVSVSQLNNYLSNTENESLMPLPKYEHF